MKVAELEGAALDAAVAKALGDPRITMWGDSPWIDDGSVAGHGSSGRGFKPSTDWRDGGPIIERERIHLMPLDEGRPGWTGAIFRCDWADPDDVGWELEQEGPTPLIAAMRAFVASKLGDEVEL